MEYPSTRAGRAAKRILIAEDDALVGTLLEETLGDVAGWSAQTVSDGAALLGAAADTPPDLVLLDVNLPGLGGLEIYRRLREREATRDVPVLFLAAKPFSLGALLSSAAGLLGEALPAI